MTANDLNIALAKWDGWEDIIFTGIQGDDDYRGIHESCRPEGMTGRWRGRIPLYTESLDAVHELEKKLTGVQQNDYTNMLGFPADDVEHAAWKVCHATALQRCEAIARTAGVWEE